MVASGKSCALGTGASSAEIAWELMVTSDKKICIYGWIIQPIDEMTFEIGNSYM